jgi:sporulation protein YlmC with PRC-barrel domain
MTALLSLEALRRHKVVNDHGENLGHVEDFLFDPEEGGVRFIILASGGVSGIGEKLFAVPYDIVEIDTRKERVVLRFDAEDIKQAPGFTRAQWPDFAPAYRKDIEGFYAARRR